MKIPGLSFSWKRALGVTRAKQQFARKTGIPTSRAGLERKVGRVMLGGCLTYVMIPVILITIVLCLVV